MCPSRVRQSNPERSVPDGATAAGRATTQHRLLDALLHHPEGLTVEALVEQLGITTNAVRQHLSALTQRQLVEHRRNAGGRGRPCHRYRLTEAGRESFPRRYDALAESLLAELATVLSDEVALSAAMRRMGERSIAGLPTPLPIPMLAETMQELGYAAETRSHADGSTEIVAMNCVFHRLAERYPSVCEFDLALMRAATGNAVEHSECMLRGGRCCRFSFEKKH